MEKLTKEVYLALQGVYAKTAGNLHDKVENVLDAIFSLDQNNHMITRADLRVALWSLENCMGKPHACKDLDGDSLMGYAVTLVLNHYG